jgi:hypothetical protein
MHTAGALDDGILDAMDAGRLASVLAAKAAGAAHLDELTRDAGLEQFVLFSSAAATFGGAGQGNYAAANAYLDALAQQRVAAGRAALSVAWGPWAGGMAQASDAARERLRRGPLPGMDPGLAVKALGQALEGQDSLLAVMDVNWAKMGASPSPFFRDLPEVSALGASPATGGELDRAELAQRLAGLPKARQLQVLTDLIRGGAAAVLGHASAGTIEADRAFSDLGFYSLTSLEMRQYLSAATGLRLPATLLFDYPAPAILAGYLWAGAFGQAPGHQSVLDELGRLESLLASLAAEGDGRAEIAARLDAISQQFRAGPAGDPAMDREFEAVTNDEMFDLVEEELRDPDFD